MLKRVFQVSRGPGGEVLNMTIEKRLFNGCLAL
jgi:hypothetical protein